MKSRDLSVAVALLVVVTALTPNQLQAAGPSKTLVKLRSSFNGSFKLKAKEQEPGQDHPSYELFRHVLPGSQGQANSIKFMTDWSAIQISTSSHDPRTRKRTWTVKVRTQEAAHQFRRGEGMDERWVELVSFPEAPHSTDYIPYAHGNDAHENPVESRLGRNRHGKLNFYANTQLDNSRSYESLRVRTGLKIQLQLVVEFDEASGDVTVRRRLTPSVDRRRARSFNYRGLVDISYLMEEKLDPNRIGWEIVATYERTDKDALQKESQSEAAWNRPDLTGLELPSSFPSDIPLPHAADISMTNRNKGGMGMWIMLTAKDRGDVVADFYRTELKRSGWTVNAFSDLKEWGELKGDNMVQLHVTNAKVQSTLFSSTDNLVAVKGKRILNLMIHGLKKPGEHGHLSMVSVSRFDGIKYRFK